MVPAAQRDSQCEYGQAARALTGQGQVLLDMDTQDPLHAAHTEYCMQAGPALYGDGHEQHMGCVPETGTQHETGPPRATRAPEDAFGHENSGSRRDRKAERSWDRSRVGGSNGGDAAGGARVGERAGMRRMLGEPRGRAQERQGQR